jgi:hypothetical protein
MQLEGKVTRVPGTYRDCSIMTLLSSLVGKIPKPSLRSSPIERYRIRILRQGLRGPSFVDTLRFVRAGGLDE